MVAALAVTDTVTTLVPISAEIKWPNDVLVRGKKISGILVETGLQADHRAFAVVGIGLNVNLNPVAYPEISNTATSLSAEAGQEMSGAMVLCMLLTRFEYWYDALLRDEKVFEAWRANLTMLGKETQMLVGGVLYEGVAEDVAPDGALLLRSREGRLIRMSAGDVTLKTSGFEGLKVN